MFTVFIRKEKKKAHSKLQNGLYKKLIPSFGNQNAFRKAHLKLRIAFGKKTHFKFQNALDQEQQAFGREENRFRCIQIEEPQKKNGAAPRIERNLMKARN
jgi:hypothetical protein